MIHFCMYCTCTIYCKYCLYEGRTRSAVRCSARLLVKRAHCRPRSHLIVKETSRRNFRNALLNVVRRCVLPLRCARASVRQPAFVAHSHLLIVRSLACAHTHPQLLIQVELCDEEIATETEARDFHWTNQAAVIDFSEIGQEPWLIRQALRMLRNEAFAYKCVSLWLRDQVGVRPADSSIIHKNIPSLPFLATASRSLSRITYRDHRRELASSCEQGSNAWGSAPWVHVHVLLCCSRKSGGKTATAVAWLVGQTRPGKCVLRLFLDWPKLDCRECHCYTQVGNKC